MAHYNLIFQGKIIDGASLDEVKKNISRLFKADAAKTNILFSGKTIVIKKNLDTESAKKYLAIIKKAGAVVKAVKIETAKKPVTPSPEKNASTTNNLSAGLASLVSYNKTSTEDEDNELHLSPLGPYAAISGNNLNSINIPDTSNLTMSEAQTGSLEEYAPVIEAIELPDIENLSMSAANTGSLQEFSINVEPVELPDISELNITEQDNTPLSSESSKETSAEIPDISNLSISAAHEGTLETIDAQPDSIKIPDVSHLEIEEKKEKQAISGKATFKID